MFGLQPPRHISTLPWPCKKRSGSGTNVGVARLPSRSCWSDGITVRGNPQRTAKEARPRRTDLQNPRGTDFQQSGTFKTATHTSAFTRVFDALWRRGEAVGFTSPSAFARVFRNILMMETAQYRLRVVHHPAASFTHRFGVPLRNAGLTRDRYEVHPPPAPNIA